MRIDRLSVKNFRNLANVDLRILPGAVIVGENRAGKSNLLHALRLILDPRLSYLDRQLTRDDFWDGLSDGSDDWDPMAAGEVIEASVEIVEFEGESNIVTALSDALLEEDPLRARLTYRFAPVDTGEESENVTRKYRGRIYGGENLEAPISSDYRSYLHFAFLHALRDVESDIRSWRDSPLRGLLQAAASAASEDDLSAVKQAMKDANDELNNLDVIKELGRSITDRLTDMVGENHAVETDLAVAPDDPLKLIRGMRLFVDGDAHRSLASASLGTLNMLYITLLELGLDTQLLDDVAHVVTAIEEPEAHLHPHLQRLVFRRLLNRQARQHTALVTTQSPYIASVADPRSLVVLRTTGDQTSIAAAHTAELDEAEWDDIARYLDVTRAELVFARRVLLAEGFGEQTLIPRLAASVGMDLDKLGVSVCAIHGTHFGSYVQLCEALDIPWAVITDGDVSQEGTRRGDIRAQKVMKRLGWTGAPADHGFFVGDTTFEYDLVSGDAENIEPCFDALRELCREPSRAAIDSWELEVPDYGVYMRMIRSAGGKGRYAQRLASYELRPPRYVADALEYLSES